VFVWETKRLGPMMHDPTLNLSPEGQPLEEKPKNPWNKVKARFGRLKLGALKRDIHGLPGKAGRADAKLKKFGGKDDV